MHWSGRLVNVRTKDPQRKYDATIERDSSGKFVLKSGSKIALGETKSISNNPKAQKKRRQLLTAYPDGVVNADVILGSVHKLESVVTGAASGGRIKGLMQSDRKRQKETKKRNQRHASRGDFLSEKLSCFYVVDVAGRARRQVNDAIEHAVANGLYTLGSLIAYESGLVRVHHPFDAHGASKRILNQHGLQASEINKETLNSGFDKLGLSDSTVSFWHDLGIDVLGDVMFSTEEDLRELSNDKKRAASLALTVRRRGFGWMVSNEPPNDFWWEDDNADLYEKSSWEEYKKRKNERVLVERVAALQAEMIAADVDIACVDGEYDFLSLLDARYKMASPTWVGADPDNRKGPEPPEPYGKLGTTGTSPYGIPGSQSQWDKDPQSSIEQLFGTVEDFHSEHIWLDIDGANEALLAEVYPEEAVDAMRKSGACRLLVVDAGGELGEELDQEELDYALFSAVWLCGGGSSGFGEWMELCDEVADQIDKTKALPDVHQAIVVRNRERDPHSEGMLVGMPVFGNDARQAWLVALLEPKTWGRSKHCGLLFSAPWLPIMQETCVHFKGMTKDECLSLMQRVAPNRM